MVRWRPVSRISALAAAMVGMAAMRPGTASHSYARLAAAAAVPASHSLADGPTRTDALSHRFDDPQPCYQYIIDPPEDCTDGTGSDGSGGGGNPADSANTEDDSGLWPSGFGVIGTYNGYTILGWASQSYGSTYRFWGESWSGCYVIGTITLTPGEAILLDFGLPTNLPNYTVTGSDGCD